jgi:hypothetical protein
MQVIALMTSAFRRGKQPTLLGSISNHHLKWWSVTLIRNIDLLHTTELGAKRIKRNLGLTTDDAVAWCIQSVLSAENIQRKGKNWYVYADKCVIT